MNNGNDFSTIKYNAVMVARPEAINYIEELHINGREIIIKKE